VVGFWTIVFWGAEVAAAALQILTANKPLFALLDNSLKDISVMEDSHLTFFLYEKLPMGYSQWL
jgi:hypothetical protein